MRRLRGCRRSDRQESSFSIDRQPGLREIPYEFNDGSGTSRCHARKCSPVIVGLWSVRDGRGADFAVMKAYALQGDA